MSSPIKPAAGDVSAEYQSAAALQEKPLGDATPPSVSSDNDPESLKDNAKADEPGDNFQKQPLSTIVLLTTTSVMAMFLVALDRTVIVTAIPRITDDFDSLPDIGWYASAYLMTCGAFQLFFGKIYSMYNVKLVLLFSIVLFEVGSAICGAAPTSIAFIIGRAVAGIGAAGILAGSVSGVDCIC